MIDFSLSKEQMMLQQTARNFAENEIRPVVEEIEKADRTLERSKVTPWEKVRPIFRHAHELGFPSIMIPEEYGGSGLGCLENVILQEELAVVDMGIATTYFNITITGTRMLLNGGTEVQKKRWFSEMAAHDDFLLCSAGSEPDLAGADSFSPISDPSIGTKTFARKDGDDYVINGTKAAFCTNAGIAKGYFVITRTDLNKPQMESTSIFYIPNDLPGITFSPRTDLNGWRTAHNAEVLFEDVRVSKDSMLGVEGGGLPIFLMQSLPYIGTGFAAGHVGIARAAYDLAMSYAQHRISWGQPIIRHQAVAAMIADMYIDLQSARLMVLDAAWTIDSGSPMGAMKSPAAKSFAVDVAIKNAQGAVKVLGSYGITKEYRASKYLNDAWIGWSCDGTNQMLRLQLANFLSEMSSDRKEC